MTRQRCESIGPAPEHFRCGLDKGHDGSHSALSETGAPWFAVPWHNRDGSEPEPVTRLLYSEPMFLQHPGTIDNPEPAPVLTFADIQAGVAKMRDCPTSDDEKSVVLPGRVALRVLSIVEAAETRGVVPGHCKDCENWQHMSPTLGYWCSVNDSWSYPADGSGFCSKFEVKS